MPAIMHILGWKAEGLRCPDHEIDCCDSEGRALPITLIQMPNGTGKTTTLSLLRAALSGVSDRGAWNKASVMELQKRNNPTSSGIFELRLLLNDRLATIILEFDFESGCVYYKTTYGSGQSEGFDPPIEFRRFMNEDFVKFYVFDGELADNILDKNHTDAQKAVDSLFQIHLLGLMESKIAEYWDEQTQSVTAKDQTGLTRRRNNLKRWLGRLDELIEQEKEYQEKRDRILKDLDQKQDNYDRKIKKEESLAKQIDTAKKIVMEAEARMLESAKGVLDSMRDPHSLSPVFASLIHELKMGLDRVKLPENAAREFFEELADEDQCVCGRPIDADIKVAIKKRADQYLGTDDVSLLNTIKSAIGEAVSQSQSAASDTLSKDIQSLDEIVSKKHEARNDLDELSLDAEHSDPDVKRAREEIDHLEKKKDRLEVELARFDGPDDKVNFDRIEKIDPERIFSIETVRKGVSKLELQVAETTNMLEQRNKRNLLKQVVQKAHAKASDHITSEIKDDANARIAELMPDNMIRVEGIDRCVILSGQSSGSAGENLSIGYAFLATLFNRSEEHQLPFVVDSPANPIDYDIRPKIGRLAPNLTNQFIAFVISSERERFLPALRSAAKQKIKYITLFRKSIARHTEKAEQNPNSSSTVDGVQVVDENFFDGFQLDSEEDT